uniref:Uncharacterized protein n=1 Tax=Anguilla anguilla TaxID=7936 RepID=A0A0E9VS84_ANGAN
MELCGYFQVLMSIIFSKQDKMALKFCHRPGTASPAQNTLP